MPGGIIPTEKDALIGGCGGNANKIRGNSLYFELINSFAVEYYSLKKGQKRQFAVEKVINPLREDGGRFLTMCSGAFRVVESEKIVQSKVMNALRDKALLVVRGEQVSKLCSRLAELKRIQTKIERAEARAAQLEQEQLHLTQRFAKFRKSEAS